MFLPRPALNTFEHGERLALAVQAVEAVCALKLERRGVGRRGLRHEVKGRGVVVRVEVEEKERLECRRRVGVKREDWS